MLRPIVLLLCLLPAVALAEWRFIDPAPGNPSAQRRIEVSSLADLPCGMFRAAPATLSIACIGPTRSVTIETPCILAPLGGETAEMRYRIDKGGLLGRRFAMIGQGRSLQLPDTDSASLFLDELRTGEVLTVPLDAANRVPAEAAFPLIGLEPALMRLDAACGG